MGLDTVELMMQVEDEFDVQIPNDQWWRLQTVGDMCAMVASLSNPMWKGLCRHPRAFCTLRRGLMQMGHERHHIRTKTPIHELFPRPQIRRRWQHLTRMTGYKLPDLRPPIWILRVALFVPLFLFVAMTVAVCALFVWPIDPIILMIAIALTIVSPCSIFLLPWLTRPFAVHPDDCDTVGDLVRWVVRHNTMSEMTDQYLLTGEHHFARIRAIVSEQLNIPEAEIHLHSRFIEDLRAN